MRKKYQDKYLNVVDQIKGWFVYDQILNVYDVLNNLQQGTTGDLLEIGVYYGKSLIPLLDMAKPNETCIGIDVFEDQHLNMDESGGHTTINSVRQNIIKVYDELPKHLKLVKQCSGSLTDKELLKLSTNNIFRFISIDGCHTFDYTFHDLSLAANSISEDGIIVIDDYTNADWPGVKAATDHFLNLKNNLQPIYAGANKLILCSREVSSTFYKEMEPIESNIISRQYIRHKKANMWKGIKDIYK
jgi:hypothetical protein